MVVVIVSSNPHFFEKFTAKSIALIDGDLLMD
jgi:hypothetical protein